MTVACLYCRNDKIEVNCDEELEDIQCPSCRGTGGLILQEEAENLGGDFYDNHSCWGNRTYLGLGEELDEEEYECGVCGRIMSHRRT